MSGVSVPSAGEILKTSPLANRRTLENALSELVSSNGTAGSNLGGHILTLLDCKVVEKISGTDCHTAALLYSQGRYYVRVVEKFFSSLTDAERVAVLQHEVSHFILKHIPRRGGRDPRMYNVAADMVINQEIRGLPKGCITLPPGWAPNQTTEFYYDELVKNKMNIPPMDGMFGSGVDALEDGAEEIADDIIRRVIKQRIDSGVDPGTLAGMYGGALSSYIKELTAPQIINWKHALTRFAASLGENNSRKTLHREDRRGASIYGKKREKLPRMIVVVDSSGSVSNRLLEIFFSQIFLLGKKLQEIAVIVADAQVQAHFAYRRGLEKTLLENAKGRGGTDFTPAVEYINANLRDYDGAVYLTDGYCDPPSIPCKVRMIWVVAGEKNFRGTPQIQVREEEYARA